MGVCVFFLRHYRYKYLQVSAHKCTLLIEDIDNILYTHGIPNWWSTHWLNLVIGEYFLLHSKRQPAHLLF